MNAHDRDFTSRDLAVKLHYGDGGARRAASGRYVVCAVSGQRIPLEQLRYWSAPLQEAYAGPAEALKRWRQLNPSTADAPSIPASGNGKLVNAVFS